MTDWLSTVDEWKSYDNERLGNCTVVAAVHLIRMWTAASGQPFNVTEDDVADLYHAMTGYEPTTGCNDTGVPISRLLAYWHRAGIGGYRIAGHELIHPLRVADALEVGPVVLDLNIPAYAVDDHRAGRPWDLADSNYRIVTGHAVAVGSYDGTHYGIVTWGKVQLLTNDFFHRYANRAWAVHPETREAPQPAIG